MKNYDRCCVNCEYFPQEPSRINSEWVDADGLRHRSVIRFCGYDGEIINKVGESCHRMKDVNNESTRNKSRKKKNI